MTTEDEIKRAIVVAKSKISELDILLSSIEGYRDQQQIADEHIPTDGQPFIYQFIDPIDKLPGIKVPGETVSILGTRGNADFVFNGVLQIDGDSSFVCHDIVGTQQVAWPQTAPVAPGTYWGPLVLNDRGEPYTTPSFGVVGSPLFGVDFGWRLTDKGNDRRLFQASVNSNVDNAFIPARFLGSGLPFSVFGPNHTDPFPFKHVFAKNTAVECELKIYSSAEQAGTFGPTLPVNTAITAVDVRIFVGLIGYKVYGD